MKLSEFKNSLLEVENLNFQLPNGTFVPAHFHITEMGIINKKFTDCGNTFREENYFTFQLWYSTDLEHRLTPEKTLKIIAGIEKYLDNTDSEIQVEYQGETSISKFGLEFSNGNFQLVGIQTTCLAKDNCGVSESKPKIKMSELSAQSCCAPNSGCC